MTQKKKLFLSGVTIANLVLAGGGVVCLLALSYSVYHYGSGQREFKNAASVVIYCALPAAFAVLLFASLALNRRCRIVLAICCLLLGASAYASEMFLYQYQAPRTRDEAVRLAKQFGAHFDTRTRTQVISDLSEQGIEAVSQRNLFLQLEKQPDNSMKSRIEIRGVEVIPTGGIANKITVACNQTGQYLTYKTDEHGFHNPKGIWQAGSVDIAAVGNSFTLGYCAPSDRNFVALIRRHHPATLNLGMPGEGPLHILAVLQEYAQQLKPKLVLWFFSEAVSFTELRREKRSRMLMRYLRGHFTQRLLAQQSDIDQALASDIDRQTAPQLSEQSSRPENTNLLDKFLPLIKLSAVRQKLGVVYGEVPYESPDLALSEVQPDLNLLGEILSEAKARVDAWGGQLYFVYLPCWERYAQNPPVEVKARVQILTLVSTLGIPFIDTYPVFQAHGDPLSFFPFRGPGHYNEAGHRLVAETVLTVISKRSS